MADPERAVLAPQLAQLELIGWLAANRFLTVDGLVALRGKLAHDPAYGSDVARACLVSVIKTLSRERGVPPSDDPHWPADDDPLWDAVPLPAMPDDASELGGRW